MGCRVCIQFEEKTDYGLDKSSILYHHWAGIKLPEQAREWLIDLYKRKTEKTLIMPPVCELLFEFIQYCFQKNYFDLNKNNSASIHDQDDSGLGDDAGHYIFQLEKNNFKLKHIRGSFQSEKILKRGNKGF